VEKNPQSTSSEIPAGGPVRAFWERTSGKITKFGEQKTQTRITLKNNTMKRGKF
jgi:hypothetical protein